MEDKHRFKAGCVLGAALGAILVVLLLRDVSKPHDDDIKLHTPISIHNETPQNLVVRFVQVSPTRELRFKEGRTLRFVGVTAGESGETYLLTSHQVAPEYTYTVLIYESPFGGPVRNEMSGEFMATAKPPLAGYKYLTVKAGGEKIECVISGEDLWIEAAKSRGAKSGEERWDN